MTHKKAVPSFLALTCFGVMASPALAQDSAQDANQRSLGSVTVTDTAIEEGFKANQASSPKYTQPLQDTPQTIQVITKDLFLQQGATTLAEALRNSPGVGTFYAGENGNTATGDTIYMRGFDSSSSIFVDGVRDMGSISRDVFNTEAVEVLKGPAGTDVGRTSPTGAINMVSKRAKLDNSVSGSATIGTDNQKRATADINQTIGANAAFRLNALWDDSDVPGRDHVKNKRIGIAPSIGIGIDTPTRAYLNLLYVDQDNIPDGFVPTIGLKTWSPQVNQSKLIGQPVDSTNFYGSRSDHDDVTAKMATLILEHDFSDKVKLTNITRWGQTKQDYLLTAFMTTGANTAYTNVNDLSTYTIARSTPTVKDVKNQVLTNQLNLRADFATGAVEHSLSAGIELTQEKYKSYGVTATNNLTRANLYNPDWNTAGSYTVVRNGLNTTGQTDTQAFYIFDTAKFFDGSLLITGGIRVDNYQTKYRSPTLKLKDKGTLFNWKLGAVYKPVEPVSLYVNYAVSQQPPGGANFTLSSALNNAANPNMDPQKAKTFEAGIKWSALGDALSLNAAVFQTTVYNEINSQILDDAGNPTQTGKKRVRGIELSAVGQITDAWSISGGYSYLDTKVTEGPNVAANGSNELTYTPDNAFTVWSNYRFPFGLELAGGVRHTGGLRKGTDGAVGTPQYTKGYTVVDLMLAYQVTDNIKLRVNANNLFDKEYIASINKSGYRYTPGTPQTFLFSADFSF